MVGNPNGGGSPGGADRYPDLPATTDPQEMSFIEEATRAMEAEDVGGLEPQPGYQPQPPAAPVYPEPVRPQQRQPQQPQQPMQPQQPQQQPQQRPAAQPQQQPQTPAAQATPEQQQAERLRNDPFGVQAELIEQSQQQYVDALAQQAYPITQEEMDAFLSGDPTTVSKALARVHVNAVGSVMRVISQQMPMWVGHMLRFHAVTGEREGRFWQANPNLDRSQHRDMALAAARAFRQVNPNADEATMNRMVGAMVAAAVGVQPGGQQPAVHVTPQGVRTPGPVVRRTAGAFQPAGQQPAGARPAPIENEWERTAEILMADSRGAFDDSWG